MAVVLDASVTLSWFMPDERGEFGRRVLRSLDADVAMVPGVWLLEVLNGLLVAERRGRIPPADMARIHEMLASLPIETEVAGIERAFESVLALARAHNLSTYDASYLELALRLGLPLASQDQKLLRAATAAGVRLFE